MVTIEAETLSPAVLQDPEMWTHGQVALWLKQSGFEEYADLIAFKHKIDGPALLHLHEHDFREQPLKIDCLGDIKRLAHSIDVLRCKLDDNQAYLTRQASGSGSTDAGHNEFVRSRLAGRRFHINADQLLVCVGYDNHIVPVANCDPKVLQQNLPPGVIEDLATQPQEETKFLTRLQLISREELIRTVESPDSEAKSLLKMVVAFLYCVMSVAITAFVMVVVHDRVPDMKTYPPLPDIVLDNVPLIPWAFECCELIGLVLAFISVMVLVFYKHRVIIARRMFSLLGSVFLLRCFTMLITSMSVPGIHLECTGRRYGNFAEKFRQAYIIFSGAGMSVQGVRTCGDYMFSGHTSVLTLLNYFITEYTPDSWTTLHTTTWVMNAFGVFFILAAHEHYSIDVFIAFYISSRMFMYYHAYAYNQPSLITSTSPASNSRMRLWFPLGWFFEAGGNGRVENEYDIPIGYPNLAWWRTQWWSLAGYTQVVDKNALAETMQELTSDEATTATVKDSLPSSTRMRRAPVE